MTAHPAIAIPYALVAWHSKYFGDAGRPWIVALPALAADCMDRWQLRPDGPLTHGCVALILPVRRVDGTAAALKLQPVTDQTVGEPIALRSWDGHGAVRLLEHDPDSGAMLLERLDPDCPLSTVPDDLAAIRVIAELLVRLEAGPVPAELPQLADIAAAMLDRVPAAVALLVDPAERRLLDGCAAAVRELLTEPGDRLLHWDLHYDNVLASNSSAPREPWLAIDPKPVIGDPGFELLPALWNRWPDVVATGDVPAAVRRRFDLMTEIMGLQRDRAAGWTLGRVMQTALWDLERFGECALHPAHRAIVEALRHRY